MALSDSDREHLHRCVELAGQALDTGDEPFGSVLVDGAGQVRFADHNRVSGGDHTRHPEFAIAKWAVENLSTADRAAATVYTSGEHCPMCAAAHAWVGLGRIVYAASSAQLSGWLAEWGAPAPPVTPLPIGDVAPGVPVDGPVPEFTDTMKALYAAKFQPDAEPPREDAEPPREDAPAPGSPPEWVSHAIWWHLYPLGFVGAFPADPAPTPGEHRLRRIVDWLDHAITLGASGIALGPIFASRTHGYDTTDHFHIDPRLGDDADFDLLVGEAHRRGLRVLLDGVFNHVGTDFPRYREALDGGPDSPASAWFRRGRKGFGNFEGHGDLIALDHRNPAVADYTVEVMSHWLARGADGWRLDAAYAVPERFWSEVLPRVRQAHPDAWFVGEVIHGDYAQWVSAGFDSVTQYELWKAVWSSLNDGNFHELDWALKRHNAFVEQFAPLTFVGNHDVTRIASRMTDPRHVGHALVLLFTLGGVPSVYAGDELGLRGVKEDRAGGDDAVRPEFSAPDEVDNDVFRLHQHLIGLRRRHPWLHRAVTSPVTLDNRHYVYETRNGDDALIVALNIDAEEPLKLALRDAGRARGRVISGSGAPPPEERDQVTVPPNGWVVIAPS